MNDNYCLQCSKELNIPSMRPDANYKGKLHTFDCAGCGHILVDWLYQCGYCDCSKNHIGINNDNSN